MPEPPAPALTRSGYSVPTQPPHISHGPAPQISRDLRLGAGLSDGAEPEMPDMGVVCARWAWFGEMGGALGAVGFFGAAWNGCGIWASRAPRASEGHLELPGCIQG